MTDAGPVDDVEFTPRGLWQTARFAIGRYGLLGTAARQAFIWDETRKFVHRGGGAAERAWRRSLLRRFARIQAGVPCAHPASQFVVVADLVLGLDVAGPIVECGCYRGGGTAKLSLLAARTGRRLLACDSFEGLPPPRDAGEAALQAHGEAADASFAAGQFRGTLEEVRAAVSGYGCAEACEYVPGFFADSLGGLEVRPAMVFTDVDLISSARDCLRHLWPRLVPGGLWLTHEASYPAYVAGLLDPAWWRDTLGEDPPLVLGAGTGLSPAAPSLALLRKPAP